jgi:hypothetical protein
MPPLAKALLRLWRTPEFALASARVGLLEAQASDCPVRIREYRRAVLYLEWIRGSPLRDYQVATLEELIWKIRLPPPTKRGDEDDDEDDYGAFLP